MRTLDTLIAKFNEVKNELTKSSAEENPLNENTPEELEKAGFGGNKMMQSHALGDAHRAAQRQNLLNKPALNTPHPQSMPSAEEHASRASSYDDFMPAGKFGKGEKVELAKNGQWNLVSGKQKDKVCEKCGAYPCECKCPKCGASPCECNKR